ncbi:glycosyltransferase [Paracoccus sp. (in: a-proteobacteria)]|uniref:glycosyltransferase n=1 Tax=Paracoccus sp. TaxID=267 RepID=UPI0035AF2B5D
MQWFFGYSGNASGWFKEMIKVAVISSRKHTTLQPNCLYDGQGDEVIDWLSRNGVTIHRTAVPFREELFSDKVLQVNEGTPYRPDNASGHFLRLMVPDYSEGEYSLYTDCDVMFSQEPKFQEIDTFGACAELDSNGMPAISSFNSGVMVINNDQFSRERDGLVAFIRDHNFYNRAHSSYDQALLNMYFKGKWSLLPQTLNWRPWQGINRDAEIIHFHGPKPQRISAILEGKGLAGEAHLENYINRDIQSYQEYVQQFQNHLAADK